MAKNIERKIADLFGLYTDSTIVVVAKYPEDFAPNNVDSEIARVERVLLLNPPEQTRRWLMRYLFTMLSKGDDSELSKQALAELESETVIVDNVTDDLADGDNVDGE